MAIEIAADAYSILDFSLLYILQFSLKLIWSDRASEQGRIIIVGARIPSGKVDQLPVVSLGDYQVIDRFKRRQIR